MSPARRARSPFSRLPPWQSSRIFLKINPPLSFCVFFFPVFFGQVQDKSLPRRAAQHKRGDRVSQRSLEYSAPHRVQRHQPLAAPPALRNHPGGRCQRERWVRGEGRTPRKGLCAAVPSRQRRTRPTSPAPRPPWAGGGMGRGDAQAPSAIISGDVLRTVLPSAAARAPSRAGVCHFL